MFGRLLILLVSILPRHAVSRLAGKIASVPIARPLRTPVHRAFSRVFGAAWEEAEHPLTEYTSINAFFTRRLRAGARPVARGSLVSPVDGTVGAAGAVSAGMLIQAKGRNYSLTALLGDADLAGRMEGGTFVTVYLAPGDYHRIHVPLDGAITGATYVPGDLWPVNAHAVTHVEDLFAVNERIIVRLATPGGGEVAVVLVGAIMVGMTQVAFDDLHTNARRRAVQQRQYAPSLPVRAGDPLGHFEFGSTVIVVCPPDVGTVDQLPELTRVRMGQRLGSLSHDGARSLDSGLR